MIGGGSTQPGQETSSSFRATSSASQGTTSDVGGHATGLAGPRDLRQSQSPAQPVTRHLLSRILRREWEALGEIWRRDRWTKGSFQSSRTTAPQSEGYRGRAGAARPAETNRSAFRTPWWSAADDVPPFPGAEGLASRRGRRTHGGIRAHGGDFLEDVLPLWFDVLNAPLSKRKSSRRWFSDEFPYLNGGLFLPRPGERDSASPGRSVRPRRRVPSSSCSATSSSR